MNSKVTLVAQDKQLLCRKCQNPAFNAIKMSPCGCILCGYCASHESSTCPACGKIVIAEETDQITIDSLKNMDFVCQCQQHISYADLEGHIATCQEALLLCPNDCGAYVSQKTKQQHEQVCPKRLVSCESCGLIFEADQMANHLLCCGRVKIPCANGCGETICRGDQMMHNMMCKCFLEDCQFCGQQFNKNEAEEHYGNTALLGKHVVGFLHEMRSSNEKIIEVYENFSERLSKLENEIFTIERSQPTSLTENEPPRVRTSLRVVPGGEQIGSDRVGASSLVLPLSFEQRNVYEITTVPPAVGSFLEIRNVLTNEFEKKNCIINGNQLMYELEFNESGPYELVLRAENGMELDKQDINVETEEFDISNPNNIGACQPQNAAHSWLSFEPARFFVQLFEGKQIIEFKIKRVNTYLGFGFTDNESRSLQQFEIVLNGGICKDKEFKPSGIEFYQNDDIEIIIEDETAALMENGKKIYEFGDIASKLLFVELADAEVLIV